MTRGWIPKDVFQNERCVDPVEETEGETGDLGEVLEIGILKMSSKMKDEKMLWSNLMMNLHIVKNSAT